MQGSQDEQQDDDDSMYETINPQELDESVLENSGYEDVVIPTHSRTHPTTQLAEQADELPGISLGLIELRGQVCVDTTGDSTGTDSLGYALSQCPAYLETAGSSSAGPEYTLTQCPAYLETSRRETNTESGQF